MTAFANPVPGPIIAHGAPGRGFIVTATFGQIDSFHPAPGHQGIDIGNGTCGFPILAMCDGTVDEVLTAPNGARIVRYTSTRHPEYQLALAHMDRFEVKVGQQVTNQQVIGHSGKSGTTACHLHGGCKRNGVEVDWWPLLTQNGAVEETNDMIQGTNPIPLVNKKATVAGNDTNVRPDPSTAKPELVKLAAGASVFPVYQTNGQLIAGSAIWYAVFVATPHGQELGYLHSSVISPPVPAQSSGVPQADYDAAVAATAAANQKIVAARLALT